MLDGYRTDALLNSEASDLTTRLSMHFKTKKMNAITQRKFACGTNTFIAKTTYISWASVGGGSAKAGRPITCSNRGGGTPKRPSGYASY